MERDRQTDEAVGEGKEGGKGPILLSHQCKSASQWGSQQSEPGESQAQACAGGGPRTVLH